MKRFTSFSTFVIVLFLTTSLFASGVGLTGIGARATALGGNFRGVANDWSAMFWNPAGLTQIKGMQFGGSFELISVVGKYTFTQDATMPFSVYRTAETENEPKTFPIPAAGFVYGTEKMAFGLSVYAPFGLGAEWDVMDTEAYNSAYPAIDYEDDLKVIDIHPTFAMQINEKLSVGVGLSLVYADIIIRKPTLTPNPLIFTTDAAAIGLREGVLKPLGLTASTYNHLLTESELSGDGLGFGFNFGVKYDLTECLTLGLSGSWYNDVPLDGKLTASTYYAQISTTQMQQLSATLDQLIAIGQLDQATKMQILGVYSGQKSVVYDGAGGDADLPLPMNLGMGLAYKGVENLLVTADISWTQWSSWDVIEIAVEDGSKEELVENWEDGIRMGLGLEYNITEALAVRGGYYTEPAAPPDETLTITIPDPGRRHVVNLGASYNFGMFSLYASAENLTIGDREVKEWNYNTTAMGYDNMAGLYKMTAMSFMSGLQINF